mmetsp:Transcript_12994/g.25473  ORF Transcript_12994/g.25473 Transcript_12994/m.25473 type:complete len:525 (-) Transcript_12994:117-1691(-)
MRESESGRSPGTPHYGGGLRTPTSTTRSRRVVQRPQKFDEQPQNNVKLSGSMTKCRNLVQALLQHRHSWLFKEPVDPIKLGIPQYPNIIKKPMDVGTVKEKLIAGMYGDVDEFGADVRLVWNNAIKFNGRESEVGKSAMEMSQYFEERFRKIQKGPFIRTSGKKKKGKGRKNAQPDPEVSMELVKLKREVDLMRKKINKYSSKKGPSKVSKNQPLTYKEKQQLKKDILGLSAEKLPEVVEIISRRMPQLNQGGEDEVEIDIDQLDIPTLRELQQHVRRTLTNQRRRKTPSRTPNVSSVGSPPPLYRTNSAPMMGGRDKSSSSSESSESDSDSDSSDSEGAPKPSSKPKPRAAPTKSAAASFGDPSLFSSSSIVPGASNSNSQPAEDVKMNPAAWSNFGAAPEQQTKSSGKSNDTTWAEFQQKNLEKKQRQLEEKKLAEEAKKQKELEKIRKKEAEEEARKLAEERRREEEQELKKRAEEEDAQLEADIQARREAARRAREQKLAISNENKATLDATFDVGDMFG